MEHPRLRKTHRTHRREPEDEVALHDAAFHSWNADSGGPALVHKCAGPLGVAKPNARGKSRALSALASPYTFAPYTFASFQSSAKANSRASGSSKPGSKGVR
jgi:hypothetical protein